MFLWVCDEVHKKYNGHGLTLGMLCVMLRLSADRGEDLRDHSVVLCSVPPFLLGALLVSFRSVYFFFFFVRSTRPQLWDFSVLNSCISKESRLCSSFSCSK